MRPAAPLSGRLVKEATGDVGRDAHSPRLGHQRAEVAEFLEFSDQPAVQDGLGGIDVKQLPGATLPRSDRKVLFTVPIKILQLAVDFGPAVCRDHPRVVQDRPPLGPP